MVFKKKKVEPELNESVLSVNVDENVGDVVEPEFRTEFPCYALGMHRQVNGTDVRYVLVQIPYDPENGDVGFVKELAKDIKEDIIDKFKTEAVNFFRSEA